MRTDDRINVHLVKKVIFKTLKHPPYVRNIMVNFQEREKFPEVGLKQDILAL